MVQWMDVNQLSQEENLHSKCLCISQLPLDLCDSEELSQLFSETYKPVFCQVGLPGQWFSNKLPFHVLSAHTPHNSEKKLLDIDGCQLNHFQYVDTSMREAMMYYSGLCMLIGCHGERRRPPAAHTAPPLVFVCAGVVFLACVTPACIASTPPPHARLDPLISCFSSFSSTPLPRAHFKINTPTSSRSPDALWVFSSRCFAAAERADIDAWSGVL